MEFHLVSVSKEEDFNMNVWWEKPERNIQKNRMLTMSLKHESCGVKSVHSGKLYKNQWSQEGTSIQLGQEGRRDSY